MHRLKSLAGFTVRFYPENFSKSLYKQETYYMIRNKMFQLERQSNDIPSTPLSCSPY